MNKCTIPSLLIWYFVQSQENFKKRLPDMLKVKMDVDFFVDLFQILGEDMKRYTREI